MPDKPPKTDKEAYQQRLDRITELFADMVRHADKQASVRCPYRDRHDRCTGLARCRMQLRLDDSETLPICTHDGTLDYRVAWDSEPAHYDRAKKKISRIKREARARRDEGDPNS
jgi:hypothetical protein